ncbi:YcaO-like family protein [Argonema antarcticum]|uniref:YcaO-like family protein n=1 Tax=Argonema antarcticum TaxID=2942763 RepID=UPI002010F505|nr:YcaO-like family protein [Argonema antarcticum]MCL1470787.1 YcaO-like family protein [Argonema antarcticum A004/B2]
MKDSFKPRATCYGFINEDGNLAFLGIDGQIVFTKEVEKIQQVLSFCNGKNTIGWIKQRLKTNLTDQQIDEILKVLEQQEIILDGRKLYKIFDRLASNPQPFYQCLSPSQISELSNRHRLEYTIPKDRITSLDTVSSNLLHLCKHRKTIRDFKRQRINTNLIGGLLQAIVSTDGNRSTPSAGGLYPLTLYLLVLDPNLELEVGVFKYHPQNHVLENIHSDFPEELLFKIFDCRLAIETASIIIIISADIDVHPEKYSNRGYLYTLLEAGHAAQNGILFTIENSLGVWEYGGFSNQKLNTIIQLQPHEQALISLFIGVTDPLADGNLLGSVYLERDQSWQLQHDIVGEGKPIEWFEVSELVQDGYEMPLWFARAKYRYGSVTLDSDDDSYSFATDYSIDGVIIKVLAEGFERYQSSIVRIDKIARLDELDAKWINPDTFASFHPEIYSRLDALQPFSRDNIWQWVKGKRITNGEPIYATIDNVFYPMNESYLGRKRIYFASSNGVAAHFEYDLAVQNGLLELIERDALCVTWYAKRDIYSIPESYVNESIQKRISHWNKQSWSVKLLDFTLDSVPVVFVVFWSESSYPSFVCGGAAHFSLSKCIEKAFNEAEFGLMSWRNCKRQAILPQTVETPVQHGLLYFYAESLQEVEWLISSPNKEPFVKEIKLNELVSHFDPVVFDLHKASNLCSLNVVYVLSEKLMPVNFGYGTEAYGHQRIKDLGLKWSREYPSFPHFLA